MNTQLTDFELILARKIGLHPDDYKAEITDIMIMIAKGICWSAELHLKAKNLSDEIKKEFELYSSINH